MVDQLEWLKMVDNERRLAALYGERISESEAARRLAARGLTRETMRPAPAKLPPRPVNHGAAANRGAQMAALDRKRVLAMRQLGVLAL